MVCFQAIERSHRVLPRRVGHNRRTVIENPGRLAVVGDSTDVRGATIQDVSIADILVTPRVPLNPGQDE